MLKHIITKEIWENISSPKFIFTFLLCTVLIVLSVYTGIGQYRADFKEYNSAVALNKKSLEGAPNWQTLAGLGTKITKPPQVLGTLATGIQDAVGRNASVNIAYDPQLVDSKYDANPVFAIFGQLDLTLIVKIVLSLFAILFTYDAIVGEKERGTLKLALANRVPRDQIILGKAIGSFVSLLVPLVIPFLIGLIMLKPLSRHFPVCPRLEPHRPAVPVLHAVSVGFLHPGALRVQPDPPFFQQPLHSALRVGALHLQ